jgi:hypothetical protein
VFESHRGRWHLSQPDWDLSQFMATAAGLAEACGVFDAVSSGTGRWPNPLALIAHDARSETATLPRLRVRLQQANVGEKISERTWRRTCAPYLLKLKLVASEEAWPEDAASLTAAPKAAEQPSQADGPRSDSSPLEGGGAPLTSGLVMSTAADDMALMRGYGRSPVVGTFAVVGAFAATI